MLCKQGLEFKEVLAFKQEANKTLIFFAVMLAFKI